MFRQPAPPHDGATVVARSTGWPIHGPIAPLRDEPIVEKRHPSAFQDTDFDARLKQAGIDRLVICGMQSEYCADSTTCAAYSLGYKLVLVADAHTTFDTKVLSGAQIQAHHNLTLGSGFAQCMPAAEVDFLTKAAIGAGNGLMLQDATIKKADQLSTVNQRL